jgi:hypothetical protein
MVDLGQLERRARRVAGWGRARMAARVGVAVAPIAFLAVMAGGEVEACACLGGLLFAVAGLLRFWGREGVDAVRLGLGMGLVPLFAALALRTCGVDCAPLSRFGQAELLCVLAGVAAGAGVALRASHDHASVRTWALATGVASATAALGCVGLGAGGLLVTLASVAAASLVVAFPLRARLA